MPRPTEPVKRISYAYDITLWAFGVNIPELEHRINGYLTEMSCFLQDNSAPKSIVTVFTTDPMQANTHPKIKISDAGLHLVRNPKLLGVYLNTLFSFNANYVQMANRLSERNNCQAPPVWSTNASDTCLEKIQRTQNEALKIITGSHNMSSTDHLHSETKMLLVEDHLNLLSVQYLVH